MRAHRSLALLSLCPLLLSCTVEVEDPAAEVGNPAAEVGDPAAEAKPPAGAQAARQSFAEGHQPDEEAAVLSAMDRMMQAISANDLEAMAAMQTPEGMTYRAAATDAGAMEIVARPNSFWVDPAREDERTYRERYWSPTVLIRGHIALVWAPYEFWIDGETTHCGVDVFDFVKIDGEWRVANSMWTVEPEACDELRPADAAMIRPAD